MLGEVNRRLLSNLRSYRTAGNLADYIAGLLSMPLENKIDLLVEADGVARLVLIVEYLEQEIRVPMCATRFSGKRVPALTRHNRISCCVSR